ncbi:MAG: GDCCVxC domain-containing (seleno)protein [Candidatus Halalkalibacterium sp. M3_1C_030]
MPKPDRRRSGYRIFTQRHIDQIKFIKRSQELGFTLSEIKELLELRLDEDTTCSEIKSEAQEKYRDVEEKIEDLKRIKETLIELIDSCAGEGPKGECPILGALEGESQTGKNYDDGPRSTDIYLKSTIICPKCRHQSTEEMPTDSCLYFWQCPNCKKVLKPLEGDCCVFCSFGDHPCPPVQKE